MSTNKKRILFLTGTRADFGKLKSLIDVAQSNTAFDVHIFVTGMHELKLYGHTVEEVIKCGYKNIHRYVNQYLGEPMEMILSNTIAGLSRFIHENKFDMIVVHGDRVEALAGAIVGVMQNILVAHIEGGERSGTVDEMIRHSVSKLSHIHFVANQEARKRLIQMGESDATIFPIGSPDIDIMLSKNLPNLDDVKKRYNIDFNKYAVAMFHPITTEIGDMRDYAHKFVDVMLNEDGHNYVVIYPNNDEGTIDILDAYKRLEGNPRFKIFPSIRFEYFLTLLKNSEFCIGNSSAGIREAPFYGVPTINIGTRQNGRYSAPSILNTSYEPADIKFQIKQASKVRVMDQSAYFGEGTSAQQFEAIINSKKLWDINPQKSFFDYPDISNIPKNNKQTQSEPVE